MIELAPPGPLPVLFLSGAGLPEWIWDPVRSTLADRGTAVLQPPRSAGASLADYADAAAEQAPAACFAVVAHSAGGVVAAELLARHSGRVRGLLAVSAVVPRAGRSFVGSLPVPARFVLGAVLRLAGTRPPERSVRGLTAGLPPPTGDRIVHDFAPEALRLYRDAVSPGGELPPVRGCVRTTEDRELPRSVQEASARVLSAQWSVDLATGHLPMLQDPERTSGAVRRMLAEVDG